MLKSIDNYVRRFTNRTPLIFCFQKLFHKPETKRTSIISSISTSISNTSSISEEMFDHIYKHVCKTISASCHWRSFHFPVLHFLLIHLSFVVLPCLFTQ